MRYKKDPLKTKAHFEEKAPEAAATLFGFGLEEQERFQERLKEEVVDAPPRKRNRYRNVVSRNRRTHDEKRAVILAFLPVVGLRFCYSPFSRSCIARPKTIRAF